jgi:hypothetical protein
VMSWRKRVGVEPTTLAAKDRINGFEGHEDHRTLFASVLMERTVSHVVRYASLAVAVASRGALQCERIMCRARLWVGAVSASRD